MDYPEEIRKELDRAARALEEKNEGMARVCSRRAAGAAIRQWTGAREGIPAWADVGRDVVKQLRALAVDESFPAAVRDAAARLSTTVDENHALPFEQSPLDDARLIIANFPGASGG